jgi:2-dehydro-3-deoxyphosphogluconate aldolase/(4S)-4-hydroxy-2-oxoglutarate aldolase
LMPTGGVSLETAEQWIRAGCVALGVGGELTKDPAAISEKARQLLAAVRKARGE